MARRDWTTWIQLVWIIPLAFIVGSSLWLGFTVPAGAALREDDGHCYRVETRRLWWLSPMGYLYWEIPCP